MKQKKKPIGAVMMLSLWLLSLLPIVARGGTG